MDHFGIKYQETKGRYLFTYCLLRSLIEEEKKELKRENTELFDINFIKEFNDLPNNNETKPFGFQPSVISTTPSLFGTATVIATDGTTEDNGDDELINDTTPNIYNSTSFNFSGDNLSSETLKAFTFGGTVINTNNTATTTNGFNFTGTSSRDDNNIGTGFNFVGSLNNSNNNITNTNAFNFNQTTTPSNNNADSFTFGSAVIDNNSTLNNVGFSFAAPNNTGFNFGV